MKEYFNNIPDPRQQGKVDHNLCEIVIMTICAVISNCDIWEVIADFCKAKEQWFRDAFGLKLENGVASHDTFQRIFQLMDPLEFEKCFIDWIKCVQEISNGDIVSIDGKTLRGSGKFDKKGIHMVSAWAAANRLVLGQVKTDEKSNEITAIPTLLDVLLLKGCIVTIDAMGCQKTIAAAIIDKEADYVLSLKGNQQYLHEAVKSHFESLTVEAANEAANEAKEAINEVTKVTCEVAEAKNEAAEAAIEPAEVPDKAEESSLTTEASVVLIDGEVPENTIATLTTKERGHGRVETREFKLETNLDWLWQRNSWKGLNAVGSVRAIVEEKGKITEETRYFITSLTNIDSFAKAVRAHWGIENGLHWCLDVAFREDENHTRKDNSAENLAVVRHIAINALKMYPAKMSLNRKRNKCGYDAEFMSKVLLSLL